MVKKLAPKNLAGKSLFITGTDTDVGKSIVTLALALALEKAGYRVGVYKPLQSGAYSEKGKLVAPDLALMQKFSGTLLCGCSYLLEGECSPALALKLANSPFSMDKIQADFLALQKKCDIVLVEGAGGLLCPVQFEQGITMADVIKSLGLACVIVARSRLGTVNHCLMTDSMAKTCGLQVKGILLNRFPQKTEDIAVQHVCEEIAAYTKTPIFCIPEVDVLSPEKLAALFQDTIDRIIG